MTDVLTASYFSELIGISTVETTSIKQENSLEGDIVDYGQKSISTQKRNLLNVDEILRIPSNKLLVNLRGNSPLLLDKIIYTEHPLAKQLTDSSINDYNPIWTKNIPKENIISQEIKVKQETKKKKTSKKQEKDDNEWLNFK